LATITLGEITDLRAVSPLNKILIQDSHEMVRQAANEALAKITNPDSIIDPIYSNPAIANLEASSALYGMTLSDILNPNIEILREKLNNYSTINENKDLSSSDNNPDNIPF
jgi:HEAT repeat protein